MMSNIALKGAAGRVDALGWALYLRLPWSVFRAFEIAAGKIGKYFLPKSLRGANFAFKPAAPPQGRTCQGA